VSVVEVLTPETQEHVGEHVVEVRNQLRLGSHFVSHVHLLCGVISRHGRGGLSTSRSGSVNCQGTSSARRDGRIAGYRVSSLPSTISPSVRASSGSTLEVGAPQYRLDGCLPLKINHAALIGIP